MLTSWLQSLEKRFALNTIGFVIAIVSVGFAIYIEYFRQHGPGYTITIQTEFDVLSLKENVDELQISYDGIDLRSKGLRLCIVGLELQNDGAGNLPLSAYDPSNLPGLIFDGAKVLRLEVGQASNEYLKAKFVPSPKGATGVVFPAVMLDAGDAIAIKVLLLVDTKNALSIRTAGKILGLHHIPIRRTDYRDTMPNFWSQVITGAFIVHLVRAIGYLFVFVIVIVIFVVPLTVISDYIETRRRRRVVSDFKSLTELKLTEKDDVLFRFYETTGQSFLRPLQVAMTSSASFTAAIERSRVIDDIRHETLEPISSSLPAVVLQALTAVGYAVQSGEKYDVDPAGKNVVDSFVRFLEARKMLSLKNRATPTRVSPPVSNVDGNLP